MKVKLEEIIEAMEFADMETEYYYDTKKDKLYDLNLEQQWYSYKDSAYERIARNGAKDMKLRSKNRTVLEENTCY